MAALLFSPWDSSHKNVNSVIIYPCVVWFSFFCGTWKKKFRILATASDHSTFPPRTVLASSGYLKKCNVILSIWSIYYL